MVEARGSSEIFARPLCKIVGARLGSGSQGEDPGRYICLHSKGRQPYSKGRHPYSKGRQAFR